MTQAPTRIAMWSGPRNISTAMMRAFENRTDTVVSDEPLYGYYLHATGLDHPGAAQVIADMGDDWRPVIARLVGAVPEGAPIWYQKHMVHHLLPEIDRHWLQHLTHCFLIREPAAVLASYYQKRENVCADDLGFIQQSELFDRICQQSGTPPPVIDAVDLLRDPASMMPRLCAALQIPYSDRMLSWPAGPRDSDGIWATHWYASVESSTGFKPYRHAEVTLDASLQRIADACHPHYRQLHRFRLRPDGDGQN